MNNLNYKSDINGVTNSNNTEEINKFNKIFGNNLNFNNLDTNTFKILESFITSYNPNTTEEHDILKDIFNKYDENGKLKELIYLLYFIRDDIDKLLLIEKSDISQEIFKKIIDITNLLLKTYCNSNINDTYIKVFINKIKYLIEETSIVGLMNELDNELYLKNEKKSNNESELKIKIDEELGTFSDYVIKSGAFIKSITNGKNLTVEEFNELSPDFSVVSISLDDLNINEGLIKSDNWEEMLNDENYNHPEKFGSEIYKMLYENYNQTYGKIDKGWLGVNIRGIARDLTNKTSRFYIMRDDINNEVVAVCKTKQLGDNNVYIGTHYVSEKYRKSFGIGNYIMNLALNDNKGKNIIGAVARNNPSCQRHFNFGGYICNGFVIEKDSESKSNKGLKMKYEGGYNGNSTYKSKNKNKYPDDILKNYAGKEKNEGFIVKKMDTRYLKDDNFVTTSELLFNNGYVLTRLFYNNYGEDSDLESTYCVYEKKHT